MESKPDQPKEEEIILYQEGGDSNANPVNNEEESSSNQEEFITNEEFLLECARFGELDELKNAIKTMKELNQNYKDDRGNTALHMAAANGHAEFITFLIKELKCSVNEINKSGSTPLHWAALNGQKDAVKILLENEADCTIKNNTGKTASEEAYNSGYFDISEMIITEELKKKKPDDIIEEDVENK